MRTRSILVRAALAGTMLTSVASGVVLSGAGAAPVETCKNEFSQQFQVANKLGTEGPDYFSGNLPEGHPNKLRPGDVLEARGGNDTVDLTNLFGVTLCLGSGNDVLANGTSAVGGVSVRGGPGSDTFYTTFANDAVNGLDGFDRVFDPSPFDLDTCRQVEAVSNCEILLP